MKPSSASPAASSPSDRSTHSVSCCKSSGRKLSPREERLLKAAGISPEAFKKAQELRGKDFVDLLTEIGGEVLKEYFDVDNIKKCYSDGNVEACFWALVNNLPWGKALRAIEKFPEIAKAIKRLAGMGKLLDESADAKKLVNESEGVLKKFQEGAICPISNKPKKNSFIPETPVLMADGTRKPIKDVLTGQQILATDPETGATAARVVTNVITGEGRKHLVEITIAKGGEAGNAVGKVTATAAHPFWVENQHRWRDAEELKAGDRLRTPDGELNEVIGSRAWTETRKVYNLTVDGLHTYYVLAGAVPVLVHNSSWCTEEDRFEDAADIATGHANSKHATEFPGVSTSDLTKLTQDTMKNPSRTKDLGGGRKAYLGKDGTTVVIHDPMHQDGGTVFRREPTTLDDYWQGLN